MAEGRKTTEDRRACAWEMLRHAGAGGAGDILVALSNLLMQFMAFSAVGWAYEIINDMICRHGFFPRASLAGPWCPIYGIGGLVIVLALHALPGRRRHGLSLVGEVIVAAVGICCLVTAVELMGSYVCEWVMGYVPWDYSSYWGNFEGRIAPEFTIRFVIGGLVFLYLLDPAITGWCSRNPTRTRTIAVVLVALFALDNALEASGLWASVIPRGGIPF